MSGQATVIVDDEGIDEDLDRKLNESLQGGPAPEEQFVASPITHNAEPKIIISTAGKPFKTNRAARAAASRFKIPKDEFTVVKNNGGYAICRTHIGHHPDHETHAAHETTHATESLRSEASWRPPAELEAPPPRTGFVQRWIRVELGQRSDTRNVHRAKREGWAFRQADTLPEDYKHCRISEGPYSGLIGIGDLILAEQPHQMAAQRKAFFDGKRRNLERSVEQQISNVEVPGHPIAIASRSQTQYGNREKQNLTK